MGTQLLRTLAREGSELLPIANSGRLPEPRSSSLATGDSRVDAGHGVRCHTKVGWQKAKPTHLNPYGGHRAGPLTKEAQNAETHPFGGHRGRTQLGRLAPAPILLSRGDAKACLKSVTWASETLVKCRKRGKQLAILAYLLCFLC